MKATQERFKRRRSRAHSQLPNPNANPGCFPHIAESRSYSSSTSSGVSPHFLSLYDWKFWYKVRPWVRRIVVAPNGSCSKSPFA